MPLVILAISGSLRSGSYNTALLRHVKGVAQASMDIEIITPKGLPLYDGDEEAKSGIPPAVEGIVEKIRAAQGIIISTPEYNFSIPGGLKNLTDWVSRVKQQPFKDKPVGIIGASNGKVGTARSQYHLRQNLQALSAITMPRPEVFVTVSKTKFDESGKLADQTTIDNTAKWIKAFEEWVKKIG
jgi:chromate reductase, NAD(P)H dehydrogenase (quinone)